MSIILNLVAAGGDVHTLYLGLILNMLVVVGVFERTRTTFQLLAGSLAIATIIRARKGIWGLKMSVYNAFFTLQV